MFDAVFRESVRKFFPSIGMKYYYLFDRLSIVTLSFGFFVPNLNVQEFRKYIVTF